MALFTRKFTDIDLDFDANPITKDVQKKVDAEAIGTSIRNLLSTSHYERLFNPDIGCNLKRYLFEPIDDITTNNIQEEIVKTIKNYERRVELMGVNVVPQYDLNAYEISVKFFTKNDPLPITISFFLERVR
jgi:uncharacterized protein